MESVLWVSKLLDELAYTAAPGKLVLGQPQRIKKERVCVVGQLHQNLLRKAEGNNRSRSDQLSSWLCWALARSDLAHACGGIAKADGKGDLPYPCGAAINDGNTTRFRLG